MLAIAYLDDILQRDHADGTKVLAWPFRHEQNVAPASLKAATSVSAQAPEVRRSY